MSASENMARPKRLKVIGANIVEVAPIYDKPGRTTVEASLSQFMLMVYITV